MGKQLDCWTQDLEMAESLLRQPGEASLADPVDAFVAANLKNVADSLNRFGHLTAALTEHRSDEEKRELVASAQLETAHNALVDAISVLEETRSLFKSKQLARLRRRLQAVVDNWFRSSDTRVA